MAKTSAAIVMGIILAGAVCWAASPFHNILRAAKDHSAALRVETRELEDQVRRLQELSIEIDDLSRMIEYPDQDEKMARLKAKTERLEKWVVDLGYKMDVVKDLTTKLSQESSMLLRRPLPPPQGGGKCGPGKVWIPRQKSPSGKWVPGHCAPSY